jgi:peptide/nickel transport system ATP-binding protein
MKEDKNTNIITNDTQAENTQQEASQKENKKNHYISRDEARRIAKENFEQVKRFEAYKKRKNVHESEYITQMKDDKNVVEFDDLHTYFFTDGGVVKAVDGVSFNIPQGSVVGVVGESGCGKSVTSLSLMQLVQGPTGQIVSGAIRFKGEDYLKDAEGNKMPIYTDQLDEKGNPIQLRNDWGVPQYKKGTFVYDIAKMPMDEMHRIRGSQIAMIFQEPMTSLNPVFTIGEQLDEVTMLHIEGASKEYAKSRSIDMLKLVGIAMPESIYKRYPHELSGGMRQRVMIAMALICDPELIIADEPTTALDVTIQAQILDLLRDVKQKMNGSIMLITHDLGVIAEMADYVVVMYAGRIIEMGTAQEIYEHPCHPYTIGLQKSKPAVNKKVDRLYSIPGQVPNPIDMPDFCYFKERCNKCVNKCNGVYPPIVHVSPTHTVACYLYDDIYANASAKEKNNG